MLLRAIQPQAYALMRIMTGFMFLWHGAQKVLGFPPSGREIPAFIQWVAGPIELVGGLLIMIGLLTHWVAFLCSGLMASAYWLAHGSLTQGLNGFLPLLNQGELAALYCFVFLFIATKGGGIWSVDALLQGSSETATGTAGAASRS